MGGVLSHKIFIKNDSGQSVKENSKVQKMHIAIYPYVPSLFGQCV
jgi:hypothetical protein